MKSNDEERNEVAIDFDCQFTVKVSECSLKAIMSAFITFLPFLLADFIKKILLGYAEYIMHLEEKPFECDRCGNNHNFIWKTRHGKRTKLLTIMCWIILHQLQVQCSDCKHKFYITRELLGIEKRKRIPEQTRRQLGLIGSLTTFRVAEKIIRMFGWTIDKMSIWRAVQMIGKQIHFDLDPQEMAHGEADGTGIPIRGIKKRGKELKVFVQLKKAGGIRVAGVCLGSYNGGWDKLFKPLINSFKKFQHFLLVTDGDTSIFKALEGKVKILMQRCLWHMPYQLKFVLWRDKVKRKSDEWLYVMAEMMEICAIRPLVNDTDIIEGIITSKTKRLEQLVLYCKEKEYKHSAEYLENAKPDLFTSLSNRLQGKTTSRVERLMKTVNMRINVGKWSDSGSLNAVKIRLAYYYNGFDA